MAKTKDGDLFIASDVHVVRGKTKDDSPKVETIKGGQMVSDSGLKAEEVAELKLHGVLRFPTQTERDAIDNAVDAADAAEAAAKANADAEIATQKAAADAEKAAADAKANAEKAAADAAAKAKK